MSLRVKLVLALALLSAAATVSLGTWSYLATQDRLYAEIDQSLERAVGELPLRTPDRPPFERPGEELYERPPSFDQIVFQVVDPSGRVVTASSVTLPVDDGDVAMATAPRGTTWRWHEVTVDGEPYRVVTAPTNGTAAVQVARSLAETRRLLDSLRDRTILLVVAVTLAASAAGWLIARQVTRRLERLTDAAEQVAATGRLDVPVPVAGTDEAGRLAAAFEEMLAALAASRDAQQRLVQDAGHELRTPLTSLRTNVSVLRRHEQLPGATRHRVLDDLDAETRELTALVDELVELATEQRDDEPVESVDLGALAERVADRARRRTGREIHVVTDGSVVTGRRGALERAVSNLLDNAAKFDQTGGPIDLSVAGSRVAVADRGPGIRPEDLPRVFDRFYRAVDARSRPGSGLGLAIVHDVAASHGGAVFAEARPGGGAVVGFGLPVTPAPGDPQVHTPLSPSGDQLLTLDPHAGDPHQNP